MTDEELGKELHSLCESKAEEFRWIGYEQISAADVWDCVQTRYRKSGEPPLHQMVNDILSLKATQLMNHLTMVAWKEP